MGEGVNMVWKGDSQRHSLARKGIKTGVKKSSSKQPKNNGEKYRIGWMNNPDLDGLSNDDMYTYHISHNTVKTSEEKYNEIIEKYGSMEHLKEVSKMPAVMGGDSARETLKNYNYCIENSVNEVEKMNQDLPARVVFKFDDRMEKECPNTYDIIHKKYNKRFEARKYD